MLGDVLGEQGRPRELDHGADSVVDGRALLGHDGLGNLDGMLAADLKFARGRDKRDHDLGDHIHPLARQLARSLEDRADLGLVDLRCSDTNPAAAVTHHRVHLVELLQALVQHIGADSQVLRDAVDVLCAVRKKLVERWIQ